MLRLEDLHVLIYFQELAEARLHQSRVMCSCLASLTHLVRDEAWLAAWFPVSVTSVDGSFFLVENAHKSLDYVCQKKEYFANFLYLNLDAQSLRQPQKRANVIDTYALPATTALIPLGNFPFVSSHKSGRLGLRRCPR